METVANFRPPYSSSSQGQFRKRLWSERGGFFGSISYGVPQIITLSLFIQLDLSRWYGNQDQGYTMHGMHDRNVAIERNT